MHDEHDGTMDHEERNRLVSFAVFVSFVLIATGFVIHSSLKQPLPRDELARGSVRVLTGAGDAGGTIRLL